MHNHTGTLIYVIVFSIVLLWNLHRILSTEKCQGQGVGRGEGSEGTSPIMVNPFTATACKISRLKNPHIHASKQCICWSYNKSSFNTVHFDRSPFTCSSERQKSLKGLKYGTFIGCFPSDGMARMAVKGLNDFFLISVSLSVPHLHEVIVGHMWPVLTSWVLTRSQLTVVQAKAASGGHWSHCGA